MSRTDFFDVDLQEWVDFLRDTDLLDAKPQPALSSPAQLVALERYRQAQGCYERTDRWTWTDVFLFSVGEPPRRDLTQIGGLPYRPADAPWPVDEHGNPLRFFAQIRFRESKDLVPAAAGDESQLIIISTQHQYPSPKPQKPMSS